MKLIRGKKMKNFFKTVAAISIVSVMNIAPISGAQAKTNAVQDSYGRILRDSSGGCVGTEWSGAHHDHNCSHDMLMTERHIYFGYNRYNLDKTDKKKLDALAKFLEKNDVKVITIVGYTDPMGSKNYNHELSHKRAEAVKKYLDTVTTLDSNTVDMRGFSETHQVADCSAVKDKDTKIKCLSPNRRVDIEIDYNHKAW